jgi:hypothetical protein
MFVERRQQLGEDGPGAQLQGQAGLVSSIELMRSGFCLLAYATRGRSGRLGPARPGRRRRRGQDSDAPDRGPRARRPCRTSPPQELTRHESVHTPQRRTALQKAR